MKIYIFQLPLKEIECIFKSDKHILSMAHNCKSFRLCFINHINRSNVRMNIHHVFIISSTRLSPRNFNERLRIYQTAYHNDLFRDIVENELTAANQQQALGIGVLVLVLVISPVIIFLVRYPFLDICCHANTHIRKAVSLS